MGGSTYSRPVESASVSSSKSRGSGMSSKSSASVMSKTKKLHKDLNPIDRIITTNVTEPISLGFDVTGSNIDFAMLFRDKAPMLHGQIEQQGYLTDFHIAPNAIGDKTCNDKGPIQLSEYSYGIEIDKWIEKLWLEGGGGGGAHESYELYAWGILNRVEIPNATNPYCFIIADEQPYYTVSKEQVKEVYGVTIQENIPSKEVFDDLLEKYEGNVYILLVTYCGRFLTKEWKKVMPAQHIHEIKDEKAIIDIILGIIATTAGVRSREEYEDDMLKRDQSKERVAAVSKSLVRYDDLSFVVKSKKKATTTGKLPGKKKLTGDSKKMISK
jgi:hypothetical protein